MAERSVRRRDKADNEGVPRGTVHRVASRRANSMVARSNKTPHERPDIRLQPIHSAWEPDSALLTFTQEESI